MRAKQIGVVSAAAVAVTVSGCFGVLTKPFMRSAEPEAVVEAPKPKAPPPSTVVRPSPGKAVVNFHRTVGRVETRFPLWDRDSFVGFSTPTTTVVHECEPGEHLFIAQAERPVLVRATLAADKVYDILIEGKMGMRQARVTMTPITATHRLRPRLHLYDKIRKIKADREVVARYEAADRPAVRRYLKGLEGRLGSMNLAVIEEADGR